MLSFLKGSFRYRSGCRNYALSRFPQRKRIVGSGRSRPGSQSSDQDSPYDTSQKDGTDMGSTEPTEQTPLWHTGAQRLESDVNATESLRRLLMDNQALYVERQLEMLNVFLGFEQCNKYSISNEQGDTVGHIVEEEGGLLSAVRRQAFSTHRPFRALVMDPAGTPLLWLRRPFSWINSRMYVQRTKEDEISEAGEPVLETFAEVQQVWHLFRRKYDLFLRDPTSHRRILSVPSESQPTPEPETEPQMDETRFIQLAKVDEPFLSWTFRIKDEHEKPFSLISRGFRGLARELLTDTGKYTVMFQPPPEQEIEIDGSGNVTVRTTTSSRNLTLDERALILALAVNIDFDYFSRHSHAGPGLFHFGAFEI